MRILKSWKTVWKRRVKPRYVEAKNEYNQILEFLTVPVNQDFDMNKFIEAYKKEFKDKLTADFSK